MRIISEMSAAQKTAFHCIIREHNERIAAARAKQSTQYQLEMRTGMYPHVNNRVDYEHEIAASVVQYDAEFDMLCRDMP